jgi:hypothetical protein
MEIAILLLFGKVPTTTLLWRCIMPRGDGTGPMGGGAMTGRAAGRCAGFAAPGFANASGGRGMGIGRAFRQVGSFGMGRGRMTWAEPSAQNEKEMLKSQAKYLGDALDSISKRLSSLEAGK